MVFPDDAERNFAFLLACKKLFHHLGRHDAAARTGANTSVAVLPLSKRKEVSDMTLLV